MASGKRQLSTSLKFRLSLALSAAILVTALLSCGLTFYLALDEAHELQDDTLSQVAHLINDAPNLLPGLNKTAQRMEGDSDAALLIQFIGNDGTRRGDQAFQLALPLTEGFQDVESGTQRFRVLVHRLNAQMLVAVGQETDVRNEIAFDSALRTLIPLSLLLPVLLLMATTLIRHSFRPVQLLAKEVDQRSEQDLTPFTPQGIPDEIEPFITGINKLLNKVDTAMQTQKRFIADAAHELRTPLTALSLQAERLAGSEMSTEAQHRLAVLQQGLARAKGLQEQLLALAREQQSPRQRHDAPVAVSVLFREVIESLHPLAAEKNIDIGVVRPSASEKPLSTDRQTLYTALKNITENAIRYIPQYGQIDLSVTFRSNQAVIDIEDNGPGIAEAERERVFDAFYRPEGMPVPGSGLGLSIVRACVTRLGGEVFLLPASHFASGLLVRIVLPLNGK